MMIIVIYVSFPVIWYINVIELLTVCYENPFSNDQRRAHENNVWRGMKWLASRSHFFIFSHKAVCDYEFIPLWNLFYINIRIIITCATGHKLPRTSQIKSTNSSDALMYDRRTQSTIGTFFLCTIIVHATLKRLRTR